MNTTKNGASSTVFPRLRRFLQEPFHEKADVLKDLCNLFLSEETTADLFVVQGRQTGCNSLRPPDVLSLTSRATVRVTSLDEWLRRNGISLVDFIKLDVEGAELEVLKGAAALLQNRPRPVILAEVQDARTAPWGYRAKEILILIRDAGYTWFRLLPNGSLDQLDLTPEEFDGNFVACPRESTAALYRSVLPRP